jgi:c-di-GMP-binding flagellar brake protein YcgR
MSEPVSLIPVRHSEIIVGKPLRHAVYDWHGKLLLAAGSIVRTQSQVEDLVAQGFFHDASWDNELTQMRISSPVSARMRKPSKSENSKPGNSNSEDEEEAGSKEVLMALDDVSWHVGETLYLQLHDKPSVRYIVKLIGFVKNQTVLVTSPMVEGKFEFIRDGQAFVIRAFSGKKAYAFTAAAVKSVHAPHPYLHLSYPKQVRCTVVRRGARAEVKVIASITLGSVGRTGAGTITDLSIGGASVLAKEPLGSKGESGCIKFKLHVADQDEYLNLKTILRSVSPAENGEGFRYGFEFVDVSAQNRLVLTAFVHQILVEMK